MNDHSIEDTSSPHGSSPSKCSCNKGEMEAELQKLRTDTETALKSSWNEIEALNKSITSSVQRLSHLQERLNVVKQRECAANTIATALEMEKKTVHTLYPRK